MENNSVDIAVNSNLTNLIRLIERLIHIFVWVVYLFPIILTAILSGDSFKFLLPDIFSGLLFDLFIFYAVYLFIVPLFWVGKKKFLYFISVLSLILLYPFLKIYADEILAICIAEDFLRGSYAGLEGLEKSEAKVLEIPFAASYFIRILKVIFVISFSISIWYIINWFKKDKLKNQLESQNLSGELSWLRSQINPHFLFNTLNNIYYLVYSGASEAPAVVLKLSAILRYMLYESDSPKVPLEKELNYLKDFIDLQQMRFKQENIVNFKIEGDVNSKSIAPMLLIPFVENAFKHGEIHENNHSISILLKAENETIKFEVSNYFKTDSVGAKDKVGGIGLNNIQRRLELIYPERHALDVSTKNNLFIIDLTIEEL